MLQENLEYRNFIRSLACAVSTCRKSPTECHHAGFSTTQKGVGMKVPDEESIPLCFKHHTGSNRSIHRLSRKRFEKEVLRVVTIDELIRGYQKMWRELHGRK